MAKNRDELGNRNFQKIRGQFPFLFLKKKNPMGPKVLERNVCESTSEIKAEKEQPGHDEFLYVSIIPFLHSQM